MKLRKGYRPITVNGKKLLYRVSVKTAQCFFYDEGGVRHVLKLERTSIQPPTTWRGKHGDCEWGKKEVAQLWKTRNSI